MITRTFWILFKIKDNYPCVQLQVAKTIMNGLLVITLHHHAYETIL